jgi:hypothetical protein
VTDGYLDSPRPDAGSGHAASDVESCLVLVTSYIGVTSLIEKVTTEATRRLMMSPTLGDFIELRYAHIGHHPGQGGQQSAAARITDYLLQPRPGIGRNYFAIVIPDRSAAAVEAVLEDCAASPFISTLPIRLLGIASQEDRPVPRLPRGAEIRFSPVGAWQRRELVDELLRYADSLLHDFAGGRQPGLTPDELTRYRDRFGAHMAPEHSVTPRPGVTSTGIFTALPDALGGDPGVGAAPAKDAPEPGAKPGQSMPADPAPRRVQSMPTAPDPDDAELAAARSLPRLVRRLVPELRSRRGGQPDEGQSPQPPAKTGGLAYLLLTGDQETGDPAEWNRSRTLTLEIDQRLAAVPWLSAHVRVLQGDDMELRGDLRAAGQLTKRDVRGAVSDLYLAKVLEQVRMMLGRDQARLSSGPPFARPAVVLIAPLPPMADSVAVASLRRLAEHASVTWVVPKSQADLMSEEFMRAGQLITDFTVAADDVAALFPAFLAPDAADVNDAVCEGDGTEPPEGAARQGTVPDPAA